MYIPFEEMPTHSRVWVYQADRKFSPVELKEIGNYLERFCTTWNTHGALMPSSFTIKFDQILILAVDESNLGASGCSIDSSVKTLKEIEHQIGVNLLDQGKVSYLTSDSTVQVSPFLGIKSKISAGQIDRNTMILNPVITSKNDLENNWVISAKESWLNRYFDN